MIEGTFIIEVRCSPFSRQQAMTFRDIVSRAFSSIDPLFSLTENNFAGILYIFTWSGIPKDIGSAQRLFSFLKHDSKKYLSTYKLSININLLEKGL